MKVECYRKRLINKIKYFFKNLFRRDRYAHHQECCTTTLPPLAGFRLNIASKIMEISDWRNKYDRY